MKLALKHAVTTGSITLVGCCELHLVNVLHALHRELCESWHIQLSTAVWTHLYIQLLTGIITQQVSVGIRTTQFILAAQSGAQINITQAGWIRIYAHLFELHNTAGGRTGWVDRKAWSEFCLCLAEISNLICFYITADRQVTHFTVTLGQFNKRVQKKLQWWTRHTETAPVEHHHHHHHHHLSLLLSPSSSTRVCFAHRSVSL